VSNRNFARRLTGMLDVLGSAFAVSAAVESGQRAKARDLRRLGIDPERFDELRRP
jgi:hypothetical protein